MRKAKANQPILFSPKKCRHAANGATTENFIRVLHTFFTHRNPLVHDSLYNIMYTRISQVIGWRDVPFDNSMIGDTAKGTEPHVIQVFVENSDGKPNWDFERELYRVRKVTLREDGRGASCEPRRALAFLVTCSIIHK